MVSDTTGFIVSVSGIRSFGTFPATCSSFYGRSLHTAVVAPFITPVSPRQITMKKGRFQRPMPQSPQQQNPPLPEDGTPVFALFVRTPRTKIWYPLGGVKGDDRSKNLVNALKGGIARGMYEQALDRGMAQTLYGKDNSRFLQTALRMYPQLKRYAAELEFGYKILAKGLDEQPTKPVSKEMAQSIFASIRKRISGFFNKMTGK